MAIVAAHFPPSMAMLDSPNTQLYLPPQTQSQEQNLRYRGQSSSQPVLPHRPIAAVAVPTMSDESVATAARNAARSCTTCSKAKAKCVRQPGREICERCARLRKECHSREPTVRRKKLVKTSRAAQLEKLESKIEHLVNALSIAQSQRDTNIVQGQPSPPDSERSSHATRSNEMISALCYEEMDDDANDTSTTPSAGPINTPATFGSSLVTTPATTNSDHHALGVSMPEAAVLLDRFKRLMAPSFPFVVVPANASVATLQVEKPLMLHAIVTVASFHDLRKQQTMMNQFMRDASERVLINNEKSIDIIQGILILCAWYHPYLFWAQQLTNLLHLAVAVLADLGFDRAQPDCPSDFKGTPKPPHNTPIYSRVHTTDEFRVLAGLFYMTSMVSCAFRKMDAIPFTKYLREAIDHLEEAQEYEGDRLIVQMVRVQNLLHEAHSIDSTAAPTQMYIKAFRADLENLRKKLPNENKNRLLQIQYHIAEILIWELSLNEIQENNSRPLRSLLDDLYRLIGAIRTFINCFFEIPTSTYLTIPFPIYAYFAHSFILLVRIAALDVEGLDTKALQEQLSFCEIVEEAAKRFEATANEPVDGISTNNACFANWSVRARWMKNVYEAKYGSGSKNVVKAIEGLKQSMTSEPTASPSAAYQYEGSWAAQQQQQQQPQQQLPPPLSHQQQQQQLPQLSQQQAIPMQNQQQMIPDDIMSGDFFNHLDDNFWQSFAGDFNFQIPEIDMS